MLTDPLYNEWVESVAGKNWCKCGEGLIVRDGYCAECLLIVRAPPDCKHCGSPLPVDRHKDMRYHDECKRAFWRWEKQRQVERNRQKGLCRCGRKRRGGRKTCNRCYQKSLDYYARCRQVYKRKKM